MASLIRMDRTGHTTLAEWTVDEALDHKPNAQVGDEVHLPGET